MELLNPIAEMNMPDSGLIISPEKAHEIKSNKYAFFCPDYNCKDSQRILFVKMSSKGTCFFSHKSGCEHPIMPETLLHKSAVKWFCEKSAYEIPTNYEYNKEGVQNINQGLTKLEFRQLEKHIPDVVLTTNEGFTFAIEIVVTNDISNEKRKILSSFGLPTLRVNLSKFYEENKAKCRTDLEFILQNIDFLMMDKDRKSWINGKKKISDNNGCIVLLIGITAIIVLGKLIGF